MKADAIHSDTEAGSVLNSQLANQPEDLEALIRAAGPSMGPRPVESWNPPYCGDIGIAIRRDGVWTHQGGPITRPAIVKLFASILRKDDDGRTYLVTPGEKIDVQVEDAPFLAVEMAVTGSGEDQKLTFRTNVDDVITVCAENPMRFERQDPAGGLKPYIRVRGRLEALVTRAVYADLVALTVSGETLGSLGVWSNGVWWGMG
jgi:uncharacterized protein